MKTLTAYKDSFQQKRITKPVYIDRMYGLHASLFEYAKFIKTTDLSSIEIRDDVITATVRSSGIRIIIPELDKRSVPLEILNFGSYEETEFSFMKRMISKHATVFDIGANIGWYALSIAKLFPQSKVFTFEPIPETHAYLKKNIRLNRLTNVVSYNFGFSDTIANLTFYYSPTKSGNASSANLSPEIGATKVVCSVKTMDEFVRRSSTKVDFIKCDVEGAELFVIKGGLGTIKRDHPVLFMEILRKWTKQFHYNPNQILEMLAALGYECFVISGASLKRIDRIREATKQTNFFFLHSFSHRALIHRFV